MRRIALLLAAAVLAVATMAGCSGSTACPPGQHTDIVGWYPLTINKVVTLQPIFGCVDNRSSK